jgi:phosphonate transport system ATP-binding protein
MTLLGDNLLPVVELEAVHVLFDNTCALDIERLSIAQAERVFVLGRSGSGKTTLSRIIKGRLAPSTGKATVLQSLLHKQSTDRSGAHTRRIAMIDQEFYLIPRLSVIDNILSGCLGRVSTWKSIFDWYPECELEKAEGILREVDLDGLGDRRVETLSGGQRQRTAIARALMQEADIILADEPISNLDPELAEDALELLIDCVLRRSVTLIVNLHQPALARRFASRIIGLSKGEVVYDGIPEDFTEEVAQFLYQANGNGDTVIKMSVNTGAVSPGS